MNCGWIKNVSNMNKDVKKAIAAFIIPSIMKVKGITDTCIVVIADNSDESKDKLNAIKDLYGFNAISHELAVDDLIPLVFVQPDSSEAKEALFSFDLRGVNINDIVAATDSYYSAAEEVHSYIKNEKVLEGSLVEIAEKIMKDIGIIEYDNSLI